MESSRQLPFPDLISSSRVSADNDEPPACRYPMNNNPKGFCLIFNNEEFKENDDNTSLPKRDGSSKDEEMLKKLFNGLGFKVEVLENKTASEMERTMMTYALEDHKEYNAFVCCILSHGGFGTVYGADGKTVKIKEITSIMKSRKCPSLAGKPKLFFIQACQGVDIMEGLQLELDFKPMSSADTAQLIPDEADFLIGYSTCPGYVSFRSTMGSLYIEKLCYNIGKYFERYDLASILTSVNDSVSKNCKGRVQMPIYSTTLRKNVYFKDKPPTNLTL